MGVQFAQCEQRVFQAQKRLGALNENEPNWFPSWKRARHDCSGCESKLLGSGAEFNSASTTTKLSSRASTVAISHSTDAAERINWVHSKRGSKKVQDKWERSSRISGRRSTLSGTGFSCCRERRFCRAGHHHGVVGVNSASSLKRRRMEAIRISGDRSRERIPIRVAGSPRGRGVSSRPTEGSVAIAPGVFHTSRAP